MAWKIHTKSANEVLNDRKQKYVCQIKMIVDASPVKYITTDGKCLDGSSTMRGNYKFQIELKTLLFLKFNTCKD